MGGVIGGVVALAIFVAVLWLWLGHRGSGCLKQGPYARPGSRISPDNPDTFASKVRLDSIEKGPRVIGGLITCDFVGVPRTTIEQS